MESAIFLLRLTSPGSYLNRLCDPDFLKFGGEIMNARKDRVYRASSGISPASGNDDRMLIKWRKKKRYEVRAE